MVMGGGGRHRAPVIVDLVRSHRRTARRVENVTLPELNRTGFLGDLIAWEDGVYGTSKSVFSGGA